MCFTTLWESTEQLNNARFHYQSLPRVGKLLESTENTQVSNIDFSKGAALNGFSNYSTMNASTQ